MARNARPTAAKREREKAKRENVPMTIFDSGAEGYFTLRFLF